MVGRGGPMALVACGLIALIAFPIATAPANTAGSCGPLFDTQVYKEPNDRDAWTIVLEEQRQNATCEDARLVRWLYVAVALGAVVLVAGPRRRSFGIASAVAAGLLGLAAALDGPIVPLALAAAGAALSAFAQLRSPPAGST